MSEVFEISDRYVSALCQLNPTLATSLGVPGHDHRWGDHGLAGIEANYELQRSLRGELEPHLDAPERRDRLAARVASRHLDESIEAYEAGDHFRDLRHLGSTFHRIRQVFDVMPTKSVEQWSNIISRLETIDQPYEQYLERLLEGAGQGISVARRQVLSIVEQAERLAAEGSAFEAISTKAGAAGQLNEKLEDAIGHARAAAGRFGEALRDRYLPLAGEEDAAGEVLYRRMADRMVGMDVDPDEAYAWGWEEFQRLHREMGEAGDEILPGSTFAEVKEHLETHPDGLAHSTQELVEIVDGLLSAAVENLAGEHFEVPEQIRSLTVNIAPPGGPLGVYYLRPSEDFSRPGGVWYSIGDQTDFPLYQHVSTAYHEGFPGHHLQIATAMYHREDLSRVQRSLIFYPGYSEGWAMYAEVLMGELGYLDDPRYQFGMLAKQMYRAARILVDIGLHLSRPIAPSSPIDPGDPWTFDNATRFMETYGFRTPAQAEAEVLRYLGWPGQAIAYKLGEREILSIRDEAQRRHGPGFDLKQFHSEVIENGAMRLDQLRNVVASRPSN